MSNGRNLGRTKRDSSRDPGAFVALPVSVLDCPGFAALSHPARSLLLEVARQCKGDDNGRLLLSRAYLAGRGWKSADVIQRAKAELLEQGFIFETVKGHRPNRASWYAVTWRKLDKITGFDYGAERAFEQGAYKRGLPVLEAKRTRGFHASKDKQPPIENATLIPSHGTDRHLIAPPHGTDGLPAVPSRGPMKATLPSATVPPNGHPLELPSARPVAAAVDPGSAAVHQPLRSPPAILAAQPSTDLQQVAPAAAPGATTSRPIVIPPGLSGAVSDPAAA